MNRDGSSGRVVKTADTVFGIVEALDETGPATVAELADELELAKSTVHDHLSTLERKEYVVREDYEYRLGLKFLELGVGVQNRIELSGIAESLLEDIATETGEAVWLIVEEHGLAVYLNKAMGDNAFQIRSRIGERSHLHCLAAGKALLAELPEETVETIIDRRGLPAQTPQTITDPEDLFAELEAIRDRGYAFNENEEIEGVRGVGASIVVEGEPIGAVGVGGPANRLHGDRFRNEIPNLLLGTTNEIELRLAYA